MAATGRKERFQRRSDLTVNMRAVIGSNFRSLVWSIICDSQYSSIIHKENTKEINV